MTPTRDSSFTPPTGLPLRIRLAGFNVDRDTLAELEAAAFEGAEAPPREAITPETLSAAYARISRNPADIGEIRSQARKEVEAARRSNETIVFGLGHASVAEHAVFNMDVTGISRLAVEAIERHRLVSFTEKSQRYITLDGDVVVPPEIRAAGLETDFHLLIREQNNAYHDLEAHLFDHYFPRFKDDGEGRPKTRAKGKAAEDARYVVSLATQAQFGMTLNARSLETVIRDCLAHPLEEVREAGRQFRQQVHGLAPSLVKYVETTDYERAQFSRACYWPDTAAFDDHGRPLQAPDPAASSDVTSGAPEVQLVNTTSDGELHILAALLVNNRGIAWQDAVREARAMDDEAARRLVMGVLEPGAPWDPPPREFELAEFTFEILLSAAAYGQLKRHRMATQIIGPYDPSLGWTMPEAVELARMTDRFDGIMARSAHFAHRIARTARESRGLDEYQRRALLAAAPYALSNAHRRRVIFKANARELYHLSRLREDEHAQWDIRNIAGKMIQAARTEMPRLFTLAVGKHQFKQRRHDLFGNPLSDGDSL